MTTAFPRALPSNAVGALWMTGSAVCFTIMAVALKALAQLGVSESQMVFFRCAAGFAAILPFALMNGPAAWKVVRPWPVFLRSAYSTLGFFAGFYSLAHMPLPDAQAISFSRTLFVVVLAAWLLKERVRWRRWTAVGVGFAGVLLMLRPEGATLSMAALAGIASAFFFALAIVTVKDLTKDHGVLTLVLYTNLFTTLVGLPFAFGAWTEPTLWTFTLLIVLGLSGVGAQSCYVRALTQGDASLMGLVDYIRLPLMAGASLLFFQEVPTALAMIGAMVVIGSTLYITWRESSLGVEKPKAPPETP